MSASAQAAPALTPDEFVQRIWDIANAAPSRCEPWTDARSGQWWQVRITCAHGVFTGQSAGLLDPSTAYERALGEFAAAHPRPPATTADDGDLPVWLYNFLYWLGETWRDALRSLSASRRRVWCARRGHRRDDSPSFPWQPAPDEPWVAARLCPYCEVIYPITPDAPAAR